MYSIDIVCVLCVFACIRISLYHSTYAIVVTCYLLPGPLSLVIINKSSSLLSSSFSCHCCRCFLFSIDFRSSLCGRLTLCYIMLFRDWLLLFAIFFCRYLWSPYVIGQTIIFSCSGLFFFFFLLLFPRLISAAADWMSAVLPYMVWP